MDNLNYGAIGNCKTAALVSNKGSIDWLCFPNFDSPSVFARILDTDIGGSLSFAVDDSYTISQEYFKGTNILSTRFIGPKGSFEVIDFMPRYRIMEGGHYTPPEIHRYIRLLNGHPRLRIIYDPAMNYASEKALHTFTEKYIKSSSIHNDKDHIYLYSNLNLEDILHGNEIILKEESYLLLSYNQKLITVNRDRVYLEYQRTKVYWLNWNTRSRKFSDYNEYISRSLLILKLMSFQHTGAVIAAITTSIPETIGEERNWDYRFCWLRDASMSIETLMTLGHQSAARRYMGFIKRILKSKSDSFQIMYGIHGNRKLKEVILPHLSGYENSRPVRIGNAAYHQKQNDSLGYLMVVIYDYFTHFPGTLDEIEEMWEIVKSMVNTIYTDWKKKDHGIWEFRHIEKHFVFSKVMSWVALDKASRIASILGKDEYDTAWSDEANRIKEEVLSAGWNKDIQSFTQAYDNDVMDSSLLLMEQYGFIEAGDERYISTVKRVKEELFNGGLMYRYKNDDDFGKPTSAFTICTFWLVRALYVTGEKEEARAIFDRLLSYSNHLNLFSEDLDFESRRLLGNFPQAYSHLALINTALLFDEEKDFSSFIRP